MGGLVEKRSCTDVICLILFIAFWLGMVAIGGLSFGNGDLGRLQNGYDYSGRTCGGSGKNPVTEEAYDIKDRTKLFYPYPWLILGINSIGPNIQNGTGYEIPEGYGVCQEKCPKEQTNVMKLVQDTALNKDVSDLLVCNYDDASKDEKKNCTYVGTSLKALPFPTGIPANDECSLANTINDKAKQKECDEKTNAALNVVPYAYITYPTKEIDGFSRCLPGGNSTTMKKLQEGFNKLLSKTKGIQKMIQKVQGNWLFILIAAILALVFGFAYLWFLKFFGKAMIWFTIIGIVVVLCAATGVAWIQAGAVDANQMEYGGQSIDTGSVGVEPDNENKELMNIIAYILSAVTVVVILLVIVLAKRINIAVKIMGLTTKAFSDMPTILFFPTIMWLLVIILTAWFIIVLLFQLTAGTFDKFTFTYKMDQVLQYMMAYNFFGYLWTKAFFAAVGDLTIAIAVATWYFAEDRKEIKGAVFGGLKKTLRYHIGTCAFGALIIAIVQFIRAIFNFYLKQTGRFKNNKLVKAMACCVNCCLSYLERVLKFINRNAYIQCAIHGTNFLKSAKNAVVLLAKNILRLMAITMVSSLFIFLGKMVIAFGATFVAVIAMTGGDFSGASAKSADPLTTIIIFLLSYTIAHMFMNIYNMGIDTMFQCFCEDPSKADESLKKEFEEKEEK